MEQTPHKKLRCGWSTGACATAAARAAASALLGGDFPDPVRIALPGGETPAFALALHERGADFARAGIVKDAGDDPDVTHGALVIATVRRAAPGRGVSFHAGQGVGTVTLPGLPLAVGEAAINPAPRLMIRDNLEAVSRAFGQTCDFAVEIAIPGGGELAARTMNPRLGIAGGLSILGTSGIVRPYSCAAWIAAIREGLDVARALHLPHVAGCTGRMSERAARETLGLSEQALIDMGDFAGGLLKYIRAHPLPRLTIAGGLAKMAKLGQGALDLHSARARVDMARLAADAACPAIAGAASVMQAHDLARGQGIDLAAIIARKALKTIGETLRHAPVRAGVMVVDRTGKVLAHV